MRRWPSSSRWRVARRPPSTSSVTTAGTPAPSVSSSTVGTFDSASRSRLDGRRRQRHDDQAVGPVPPGERGEVLVAVHRRLDVEQHEVVAAAVEGRDDAPEALDGRGVGEERDDHAEGLAPTPAQAAGEGVRAVVELVDGGEHPRPGGVADPRAVVEDPGDRARAHPGVRCDVGDRDHRPPLLSCASTGCASHPGSLVEPLPSNVRTISGIRHAVNGTASTNPGDFPSRSALGDRIRWERRRGGRGQTRMRSSGAGTPTTARARPSPRNMPQHIVRSATSSSP